MGKNACQETQEGDLLLEKASTPQPFVFCLSLASIANTHTQIYACTFPSPFTLLFLLSQCFYVKAAAAVWAEASPPHPERRERVSFLTSLRKSCNCSFLSLTDYQGTYLQPLVHMSHPTTHLRGISSRLYFGTCTDAWYR